MMKLVRHPILIRELTIMSRRITAVYRNGTLVPTLPLHLSEETSVELELFPDIRPPQITDPAERARVLKELTESMQNNPWPGAAGRFTREELHERG
jgi:hypothetical protein